MQRQAFSVQEACEITGIGRSLMYDLIAQGKIGSIKVGGRRIISQAHIDKFLTGDQ